MQQSIDVGKKREDEKKRKQLIALPKQWQHPLKKLKKPELLAAEGSSAANL